MTRIASRRSRAAPRRIRQYTVAKTASAAVVNPGGKVTYSVVVTNTGAAPYTPDAPATFTDDLTGMLGDAVYNNDATATAGTVTYQAPTSSWSAPLEPGAAVPVTHSVTVDKPDNGPHQLTNHVVSTAGGANCTANSTDPSCVANTTIATDPRPPRRPTRRRTRRPGESPISGESPAVTGWRRQLTPARFVRRRGRGGR